MIQKFHCPIKRYIPGVGVDVKGIQSLHPDVQQLRKEYGIPQDAFLILSVGELSVRKNQEVIIRAMSQMGTPNVYYLLCGDGDRRGYLEALVHELNLDRQVVFAGLLPHDRVLQLGYAANLGALPSLIEGLGLAGIEALAAGKPVVASGVHGIKDYVIDGETGLRCDPYDPETFKDAIIKLVSDKQLYQRCCKGAAVKAREFDIKRVREMMIENYREVIEA